MQYYKKKQTIDAVAYNVNCHVIAFICKSISWYYLSHYLLYVKNKTSTLIRIHYLKYNTLDNLFAILL